MDFSIVLVLPFAALVAFATLIGAASTKRARPRLIWPFAFSTISAAPVFLRLPDLEALGYWLLGFTLLALWAVFGTIIGAKAAKMLIAATKLLRSR